MLSSKLGTYHTINQDEDIFEELRAEFLARKGVWDFVAQNQERVLPKPNVSNWPEKSQDDGVLEAPMYGVRPKPHAIEIPEDRWSGPQPGPDMPPADKSADPQPFPTEPPYFYEHWPEPIQELPDNSGQNNLEGGILGNPELSNWLEPAFGLEDVIDMSGDDMTQRAIDTFVYSISAGEQKNVIVKTATDMAGHNDTDLISSSADFLLTNFTEFS